MIEINLARQLQGMPIVKRTFRWSEWVGIILCVGIVAASWWWTSIRQIEYESLLQEKHVQSQSFVMVQSTLTRLEHFREEKQLLRDAVKNLEIERFGRAKSIVLLDGISRSVDGLEIWLDGVQLVEQVVELRGQSFALADIGKFIDALENQQVISSLPVVEILDQKKPNGEKIFSFMLRFTFGEQVTT